MAKLCVLLSAIGRVPCQDLAMTGSVDQHGESKRWGHQPEIEGFFDLCSAVGLTGTQESSFPGPIRFIDASRTS
jgi:predicted ATP-dependent protease